jgi:hypothetical protein
MFAGLLRASLFCAFLAGCAEALPAPTDLTEVSPSGVEARIRFDGPVRHGANTLLVELEPGDVHGTQPVLTRVRAEMPAHGHLAEASEIIEADDEFQALGLELYMTGRWLVELTIASEGGSEVITFPADVP